MHQHYSSHNDYKKYFNKHVCVKITYDLKDIDRLYDSLDRYNIPNIVPKEDIHTTLFQTEKGLKYYIPSNFLKNFNVKTEKFEIWKLENNLNCLVMLIDCPQVVEWRDYIVKNFSIKTNKREFIPHITLSYNVGIFNSEILSIPQMNLKIQNEILEGSPLRSLKNV